MSASSRPPVRSRRVAGILIALALVGGAVWFLVQRTPEVVGDPGRAAWEGVDGPRPIPVRTVTAQRQDLAVYLKAIGTVTPFNTVTVRSRVDGLLLRVAFEEGQRVKQGDPLAEIDPATYSIQLAQVEAQRAQNLAQTETARRDLERFRQLQAENLLTTQQLELQQSLVAEREAALAADQAAVDSAALRLAYTKIEAPISGRLGLRQVDVGNLIRANDQEGLVVITQTQPIAVVFTIPEMELPKVVEPMRAGEQLAVEAWDRSERQRLATGMLTTVDNQIDLATGTLRLKAEFPNLDERLFPNQFVNARLRVRTLADAVVIPGSAVQYGARGTYVYVIDENDSAVVRDVVLGPVEGMLQSITEGLVPGEAVVLEGLDRLREGRKVIVTEDSEPPADS